MNILVGNWIGAVLVGFLHYMKVGPIEEKSDEKADEKETT